MSNNGTTFVGAKSELQRLHNLVRHLDEDLVHFLSSESIRWSFITPRSPNFDGLWEAGVKSFKYHLKRTLGNARVTLEEFLTISTVIEGVLNLRLLFPLSSDIES